VPYFRLPFWPTLVVLGILLGLVAGFMAGGLWPDTPLHAVASDRAENFILATGPVDGTCEAIYFLDGLSGTLSGGVLSNMGKPFQAIYKANVGADLTTIVGSLNTGIKKANRSTRAGAAPPTPEIQMPQNPHFLMVTGTVDIRRTMGTRVKPGLSVVYVAETNTGIVMAYGLPWDQSKHASNVPDQEQLVFLTGYQFSAPVIAAGG
jgi:hypothetical protein